MRMTIKKVCLNKLVDFSMALAENTVKMAIKNENSTSIKEQPKWMTLYEIPVSKKLMDQYKK
jgi:hypothetical protein